MKGLCYGKSGCRYWRESAVRGKHCSNCDDGENWQPRRKLKKEAKLYKSLGKVLAVTLFDKKNNNKSVTLDKINCGYSSKHLFNILTSINAEDLVVRVVTRDNKDRRVTFFLFKR